MSEIASTTPSLPNINTFLQENPVYLVSADLPGCGSSSLANALAEHIQTTSGVETTAIHVGDRLRSLLGVANEIDMAASLKDMKDPGTFDPDIYGDLPEGPCVIDGKLATTVGPQYIPAERPVVAVDLTSTPIVSAYRVLRREGFRLDRFFSGDSAQRVLGHLSMIENRAAHDNAMRESARPAVAERPNLHRIKIDTSNYGLEEAVEQLAGSDDFTGHVPSWEMQALRQTLATLASAHIMLDGNVHANDKTHFEHQFQSIRYNIDRLGVVLHPSGIAEVRETIRKSVIDCWFGLMMKQTPRFYMNKEGETSLDTSSAQWTPEFYKIAEEWPVLSSLLKDRTILDAFGGAGTLVNLLVARKIPSAAILSDIAYTGGKPVDKEGHLYRPKLNTDAARLLFDGLPSWYRPDLSLIKGFVTASANKIPLADHCIDYVVADPPYGKNCATGGIGLLLGSLPEFGRVAREGSILMVPTDWVKEILAAGHDVTQLTTDVSRGQSKLPVCYILVKPSKAPQQQV